MVDSGADVHILQHPTSRHSELSWNLWYHNTAAQPSDARDGTTKGTPDCYARVSYAVVSKPTSVMVITYIAAKNNWPLNHVDFIKAFLHPDLQKSVYIELLDVLKVRKNRVGLLMKSMNGLKQAPREWYFLLLNRQNGFVKLEADQSVFMRVIDSVPLYLMVYVDERSICCTQSD